MKTFYPLILLATTISMVTVQANVISLLNMTKDLGETIIDKTDLESFVPGLSDFFIATMKFVTRLIQCDEKTEFTYPDSSKFTFHGTMVKANGNFQYPSSIQILWWNFLEGDVRDGTAWGRCGGESLVTGDEFDFTMEETQEMFDKNITTAPSVLGWYDD